MSRILPRPLRATPSKRFLFLPLAFVALLFAAFAPANVLAQDSAADLIARPSTVVEGVVTAVKLDGEKEIVTLLGGAGDLDIDVSNARIVYAGPEASASKPTPKIGPGSRIVATIALPDAIPAVVPPPYLIATDVLVMEGRFVFLRGVIQGVNVPGNSFTMLFRTVYVDDQTEYSGGSSNGSVKGLSDLEAGQRVDVTVVASDLELLAVKVKVQGSVNPPGPPVAIHGVVNAIERTQWTIDRTVVGVTNETKIVGDPKVGDTVDVLAKKSSSGALTAILIARVPVVTPPSGRDFRFDGVVQSIPPTATQIGTWKISGRDVEVTARTAIVGSPKVHDKVQVTATMAAGTNASVASANVPMSMKLVATRIEKK